MVVVRPSVSSRHFPRYFFLDTYIIKKNILPRLYKRREHLLGNHIISTHPWIGLAKGQIIVQALICLKQRKTDQ